ncbi:VOC family protein [Actinobacteria bacterium YIM 96077]|uniref:VOC family protein n=1 Tax=Phytoactinopolyspora halophila TaxID=1981511 RepID=A0A329QF70_9ACTN|nr:VOC family protein [Phytoactinopolyspora halophila]AYY13093.1 VOC family protein [Actinobacteria bacterium YIM 96077]RAW11105.1 VOC family protein [Phytoactinopolyspora halophila]
MYFEIHADDPARAADFYRRLFGWSVEKADENLPVEYWRVHGDQLAGGLLPRPEPAPDSERGCNAFVVSFEVADFDRTHDRIAELGGQVALPKFAVPGRCWQGYFLDTEGNTFGIYQPDDTAG